MQPWLAEQLALRGRESITIAREKEIALGDLPDLTVSSTSAPVEVAIEVKHGDKEWSLPDLQSALSTQLAEDYLKAANRRHGVLVITNHRGSRFWRDRAQRRKIDFPTLIQILSEQASRIHANNSGPIVVRVRGLDAS